MKTSLLFLLPRVLKGVELFYFRWLDLLAPWEQFVCKFCVVEYVAWYVNVIVFAAVVLCYLQSSFYRLYRSGVTEECDIDWMEVKSEFEM